MANSYLQRTTGTPDSQTKFTVSAWVKRSRLSSSDNMDIFCIYSDSSNRMHLRFQGDDIDVINYGGSTQARLTTDRKFRDTNAWYHIVWRVDTTLSTADDRVRLYVNGVQETSFSVRTNPSQNFSFGTNWNTTRIGLDNSSSYFDGYISHIAYADGQSLAPTEFGETNSTSGIWKFKSPSGVTWGTNGFHLKFENSGALGTDSSGNTNTFTVNGNLKQSVDTPSNVHCTLNPLHSQVGGSTLTNGNGLLTTTAQSGGPYTGTTGTTLAFNKGKWYWEAKMLAAPATYPTFGVGPVNNVVTGANQYLDDTSNFTNISLSAANVGVNWRRTGRSSQTKTTGTFATNDIIMCAFDYDNDKIWFGKNGTWFESGDPSNGNNPLESGFLSAITPDDDMVMPYFGDGNYSSSCQIATNFGNGFFGTTAITSAGSNGNGSLFEYDVPTGFYALNTKNINTYG